MSNAWSHRRQVLARPAVCYPSQIPPKPECTCSIIVTPSTITVGHSLTAQISVYTPRRPLKSPIQFVVTAQHAAYSGPPTCPNGDSIFGTLLNDGNPGPGAAQLNAIFGLTCVTYSNTWIVYP